MADGALSGSTNGAASIPEWMPPVINCKIGSPHVWVGAALRALSADPDIFKRDKELVHVTRTTEEDSEASEWTDSRGRVQRAVLPGSPRIHSMSVELLAIRMGQWAHWTKPVRAKGGVFEDVPFDPDVPHARKVKALDAWPCIRRLLGVAETPFPRPDLSIVQGEAHHDRATGYLYEPSRAYTRVTEAPTQEQCRKAREALEDVFADFPFATDAGVSGAVALVFTMVARPAILGPVPAWVVGATTQGTGKSLLADACAAIAYGRGSGRSPFPESTGRNGDAEIEKRLGMIARDGRALVNFDNADKTEIGGDSLETVISCPDEYTFRILGLTAGLTMIWRTILIFTANNPRWTFGMNRRILHIGLESPLAQPEYRPLDTYAHPERAGRLLDWVLEHRDELLHHVLTILRGYGHAGMPDPKSLGTFEAWARIVASAIVWAGGADPMLCRPGADGEESDATVQRQVLAQEWGAYCRDHGQTSITSHDIISQLYPVPVRGQPPPDPSPKWDALRGAIESFAPSFGGKSPEPAKLSLALRGLADAPIRTQDAPAPLQAMHVEGRSGNRARWQVVDVDAKRKPRKVGKATVPAAPPEPGVFEPGAVLEDDEASMRDG